MKKYWKCISCGDEVLAFPLKFGHNITETKEIENSGYKLDNDDIIIYVCPTCLSSSSIIEEIAEYKK